MFNRSIQTAKTLAALLLATVAVFQAVPMTRAADAPPPVPKPADEQSMIGHWVRPDGGYVLDVKEAGVL